MYTLTSIYYHLFVPLCIYIFIYTCPLYIPSLIYHIYCISYLLSSFIYLFFAELFPVLKRFEEVCDKAKIKFPQDHIQQGLTQVGHLPHPSSLIPAPHSCRSFLSLCRSSLSFLIPVAVTLFHSSTPISTLLRYIHPISIYLPYSATHLLNIFTSFTFVAMLLSFHSFVCPFICSYIRPFVHSFIYSLVHHHWFISYQPMPSRMPLDQISWLCITWNCISTCRNLEGEYEHVSTSMSTSTNTNTNTSITTIITFS